MSDYRPRPEVVEDDVVFLDDLKKFLARAYGFPSIAAFECAYEEWRDGGPAPILPWVREAVYFFARMSWVVAYRRTGRCFGHRIEPHRISMEFGRPRGPADPTVDEIEDFCRYGFGLEKRSRRELAKRQAKLCESERKRKK